MARGIDRYAIFRSEADRQEFVDRLGGVVVDAGAAVYAWSLLPNHFHLLVRTGPTPLSLLMRRLLTGHAVSFNRRYQRCGHVFQNRFKSILVHDETYFLELVRYIHLNPLRAGVVSSIDELDVHPWTGHRTLMGSDAPAWQPVAAVLGCYGPATSAARAAYRRFVAEGIRCSSSHLDGGGFLRQGSRWQAVEPLRRGREAWARAERVLTRPTAPGTPEAILPPLPPPQVRRALDVDPRALVERIIKQLGLTVEEITGGSRRPSVTAGRTLLAHVLVRRCGLSFNQAATFVGVSKWSVRRALQRTAAGDDPPATVAELLAQLERPA